ncbi:hypothetical protein ACLOJK_017754 [Asimina triloba]
MTHLDIFLRFIIFFLVRRSEGKVIPKHSADELIKAACETNDDPASCVELLYTVPGATAGNLTQLGLASVQLAQTHIRETSYHTAFLNDTTTDERLHNIFSTCSSWHGLGLMWLDGATQAMVSRSYEVARDLSWNAGEGARYCEAEFRAAPARHSPLTQANELTHRLCQIVTRISDLLLYVVDSKT